MSLSTPPVWSPDDDSGIPKTASHEDALTADGVEAFDSADPVVLAASGRRVDLRPGLVLDRRYVLKRKIGKGGMGQVWEALDRRLERGVAVKILHQHYAADHRMARRFFREARAAARLSHPGIVTLYDLQDNARMPGARMYLVMQLLEGLSLRRCIRTQGRLTETVMLRIAVEVADAIAAAHEESVIHRDLKPDNVFLARRGRDAMQVKVLDFGIAKVLDAQLSLTQSQDVMGTLVYAPPEQIESSKRVDERVDIYGIGTLMYEGLTGHPPFAHSPPRELLSRIGHEPPTPVTDLAPGIRPATAELIHRCLAKSPDRRPSSATALLDELRALGRPTLASPMPLLSDVSGVPTDDDLPTRPSHPAPDPVVPRGRGTARSDNL
ncbi:MAG: serine/threonine-protein kinase [Sandaracinaceae bacterium]